MHFQGGSGSAFHHATIDMSQNPPAKFVHVIMIRIRNTHELKSRPNYHNAWEIFQTAVQYQLFYSTKVVRTSLQNLLAKPPYIPQKQTSKIVFFPKSPEANWSTTTARLFFQGANDGLIMLALGTTEDPNHQFSHWLTKMWEENTRSKPTKSQIWNKEQPEKKQQSIDQISIPIQTLCKYNPFNQNNILSSSMIFLTAQQVFERSKRWFLAATKDAQISRENPASGHVKPRNKQLLGIFECNAFVTKN